MATTTPRDARGTTATDDHVLLLRGINVGTAKRMAMADLRAVLAAQGFVDVETLLNSGNAIVGFAGIPSPTSIRAALADATGVDADLVILPAERFREIVAANPFRQPDREPKRLQIAFAARALPIEAARATAPTDAELAPEQLHLTPDAVYQWLPDGVLASRVPQTWWKALDVAVTARNDATAQKLVARLDARLAAR